MVSYLLSINICLCLCFVGGFILDENTSRNVVKNISVSNGGQRGNWATPQFCAAGTYAVGYTMKIQEPEIRSNTALNGIRLECEAVDGRFGGQITSSYGPWGHWDSGLTSCFPGTVFNFFALQVQAPQPSGDNTAANFVKFMCQNLEGTSQAHEVVRSPGHGFWGTWGSYSGGCDAGTAICGLRTRVESTQVPPADNSALNDVVMYCCDNN